MIKAIIFDFDGTISNRKENAYGVFNEYLRQFFKDFNEIEYEAVLQDLMIYDCNGTISVKLRLIPFINKYGKYLPEDFEEKFIPFYYDHMYRFSVLKDETRSVLEKLKGKYKLAILSNGDSTSQHNKITQVNIEDFFDEVVVTGDIGVHKPNKEAFEYVLNKLNVKNDECLMIGDVFSSDILGAINTNITPVWITLDDEIPAYHYDGYRIRHLDEIFEILEKENNK